MAMVEKNPVWLERALSQQLPYERPNPSVVGLEKMPEAWVSSGWPVSVQKQAPVNVGPQLPLKPDSSPGADLCTNAADLARRGRGSGCVLSNGGNWSLGSIGSGSGSNATGSVYQNQNAVNEGAVNEGAVNAAGLVTHGSQGVNRRGFQNGYPVGDGCGGFSRPEATGVVREPAPAVGGAFRTSQEPKTQWTGEQRVEASGDRKSSQGPNSIPAVSVQRVDPVVVNPAGQQLIAKHNYDANPDSPLGGELSIRRMDQLVKINSHPHHDAWWLARNQKGDEGYIPATYVMVVEQKVGLPWLKNRAPEEEAPVAKPGEAVKPYRSAYDKGSSDVSASGQYKCDPCGKSFNGPQPYRMHMSSRAHREVLETSS